ncbi:response regulator transcription factor [Clostridium thermarum]|uniref:response regulator transcription factor n=1 Tax=Clostridium thermarum TaxID=1716543 RepID=UPI0013D64F2E|nr:response regulator [Clostridium thermarum]
MLKMLIADDEYLVLESLRMIISKNIKDVDIVGTASSGREAIEKALGLKPDIVFIDIHMPGIDGIEAIRQIKQVNSDTVFVILTAYEYFDYAKEALNLGVFEYLLKPINKNKLIETINNISAEIYKKRANLIREIELRERMNKLIPSLEAQFISDKLFGTGMSKEMEFYESIFAMDLKHGYAMTVLFHDAENNNKEDNLKLNQQKQNFLDIFTAKFKSICPCLIGSPVSDRIIVYVPTDEEEPDEFIRMKSIDIGKRVTEKLKGLTTLKYHIGIGRKYNIENFVKSCSEAYIAASKTNDQTVTHVEDVNSSVGDIESYPIHKESVFSNSLLTANIKEAKEVFEEIFVWMINAHGEDIDKIKSKLIDLIFLAEKTLPYKLNELDKLKNTYVLNILKINGMDELRVQFKAYLSDLGLEIQKQKKSDEEGIIPAIIEYVNKNYANDITLNDVAKSVNLSYHYFSKIFKDEMGKSFTDYLTELRLEKSMKLLANPSLSIKEICQKIGYNDPNYYCKTFKKVTGMTPTEYRTFLNMGSESID